MSSTKKKKKYLKEEIPSTADFLAAHPEKKITLKELSAKVHFNLKYFSRLFKSHMGKTFTEFRLSQKIDRAKDMLSKSNLTVANIAEELGYLNPNAFMKTFKKFVGKTPTEYRKKNN